MNNVARTEIMNQARRAEAARQQALQVERQRLELIRQRRQLEIAKHRQNAPQPNPAFPRIVFGKLQSVPKRAAAIAARKAMIRKLPPVQRVAAELRERIIMMRRAQALRQALVMQHAQEAAIRRAAAQRAAAYAAAGGRPRIDGAERRAAVQRAVERRAAELRRIAELRAANAAQMRQEQARHALLAKLNQANVKDIAPPSRKQKAQEDAVASSAKKARLQILPATEPASSYQFNLFAQAYPSNESGTNDSANKQANAARFRNSSLLGSQTVKKTFTHALKN